MFPLAQIRFPGVETSEEIAMSSHRLVLNALVLFAPSLLCGQSRHSSPEQRTIEISATEKVRVTAEAATIKIGFQNQAATKDAAYAENTRAANKILQALQDQQRYATGASQSAKFTASQQWEIHSKAAEAQKVVDIAVAAGANQIEQVDWSVADDKQLEAKAYGAALKRAKDVAEQTAAQSGLKLGEIVSIVNSPGPLARFTRSDGGGGELMYAMAVAAPKIAMLKLQPGVVEREASVTVVYSVAP
jgi:uncharacterized protein YggE